MQCTWTMLSSVACPALQYLFTLSHKWHDFWGGVIEHKLCVLTFSLWIISHSKKKWAKYDHKCIFVFKYSTCYSHLILMKLEFSDLFSKNTEISYFMKICSVGGELFHIQGQMDRQRWWSLIVTFHYVV